MAANFTSNRKVTNSALLQGRVYLAIIVDIHRLSVFICNYALLIKRKHLFPNWLNFNKNVAVKLVSCFEGQPYIDR